MTTVLHIENDADCLELSRIVLTRNNYRYLSASTIEFGLLLAENEQPDLIILAARYTEGKGSRLAQHLRKHKKTKNKPLAFFCPRDEYHQIQKDLNLNNGQTIFHIEKPTTYHNFLNGISAITRKLEK